MALGAARSFRGQTHTHTHTRTVHTFTPAEHSSVHSRTEAHLVILMRSTSVLYRYACDEEGCVSNTELVKLFHGVDVALDSAAAQPGAASAAAAADGPVRTADADGTLEMDDGMPPLPAVAPKMLLSFSPDLCFPTHITLTKSYLGDAGLAAFFRVLPMLRWVRTVEARGVGAGPRAVAALSAALTAHVVEGCEVAATVPTDGHEAAPGVEPLAGGRLPALELIDLRDSDAIFAQSCQALLAALRRRRTLLRAWCADNACTGDVEPALEVLVDLDAVPATMAHQLRGWNEEAANRKYQRRLSHEAHRWQEQVNVFTVRRAALEGLEAAQSDAAEPEERRVGEQVIFRLPPPPEKAAAPVAQMLAELNAHIPDLITAACCFSAASRRREGGSGSSKSTAEGHFAAPVQPTPLPTEAGVRAALQACAEFGADALALLPHTNAALWYVANIRAQQRPTGGETALAFWEAKANVAALLRGLQANPHVEAELEASSQAGGIVIRRHLYRLRQLYAQLDEGAPPTESHAEAQRRGAEAAVQTPLQEMTSLYYRVVAALVARRFSDTHLPSMQACERRIAAVTAHVVEHVLVGEESADALAARVEHVRLCLDGTLDGAAAGRLGTSIGNADVATRVLPPVMARCRYHLRRHPAEAAAWAQTYAGPAGKHAPGAATEAPLASSSPAPAHTFHACRCAAALRRPSDSESGGTATPATALPAPCTACSYHALQAAQSLVQGRADPNVDGSDVAEAELHTRWAMLAPVRASLPRELRMFLLDMTIRQCSRLRGGCAYVPALDCVAGVLRADGLPSSTTDWLACTEQQREHWVRLLRVFGEWYRLRALESYNLVDACELLNLPPA